MVYLHTPNEVELQHDDDFHADTGKPEETVKIATKTVQARRDNLRQTISDLLRDSRAVTVAQHFMFRDPEFYLKVYLNFQDKADFLRPPFTPPWMERLRRFDRLVAALADQAHAAGVPLIMVFTVPHQAQVAMEMGHAPEKGVDPLAISRAVQAIAERHGAIFIDSTPALAQRPDGTDLFYRVDGHPNGKGQPRHRRRYLAQRLAAINGGPFADCGGSATDPQAPKHP